MPESTVLAQGAGAASRAAAARPARTGARTLFRARAWDVYLLVTVVMSAFVLPRGPGQTAAVDALNVVALLAFAAALLATRTRVTLPFLVPMLVMTAGSLVAMTNAVSLGMGFLTLAQDAYLYLWFVCLVALASGRGDLRAARIVWVCTAMVVTAIGAWHLVSVGHHFPEDLFAKEGERMASTLYNANMCADYLMLSLFVWIGLHGQVRGWFFAIAGFVLIVGLLLTKSNGAMGSTLVGLVAFAVAWAWRASPRARRNLVAAALVAGALGLIGWRAASEGAFSVGPLGKLANASFLGRMEKSAPERGHIWSVLARTYKGTPLGIGPGESQFQPLKIGEEERPGVFVSKEAHSDYLGYAIERGPAAFVALLVWFVQLVVMVVRGRGAIDARVGGRGRVLWAALIGALVASTVHSSVIEKLHFRHYWLFLALACALSTAPALRAMDAAGRAERSVAP